MTNPLDREVVEPPELIPGANDAAANAPQCTSPAPAAPAAVDDAPDPRYGWVALGASNETGCSDCCTETNELTWDLDDDGTIHLHASFGCNYEVTKQTPDVNEAMNFILDHVRFEPISAQMSSNASLAYEAYRLRSAVQDLRGSV